MKFGYSIILLILVLNLNAQTERGSSTFGFPKSNRTTHALIIGLSNYSKLPIENQLDYADADALAFYDFLIKRPDIIQPQNISLFLNEDASDKTKIFSLLSTYYKESKEGDLIILFFAGHGDIQNVFGEDDGFLLLHNVSPDGDYYYGDAININDLNRFIQGAAQRNVNVLLITDACRSGKLLSSPEKTQRVLSAISQEYEKVFKLVSCQANQASYEGKQWGNGHGVFSYYLINGIKGLADKNSDKKIRFGELSRYIINSVLDETDEKQEPEKSGNSDQFLWSVDDSLLAETQVDTPNNILAVNTVSNRSISNTQDYFFDLDARTKELIDKLTLTITDEALLKSDWQKSRIRKSPRVDSITIQDKEYFKSHVDNIYTLSFSAGDECLISGGGRGNVKIIDLSTGNISFEFELDGILASDADPRGNYFACAGWNQKIQLCNYNNGSLSKEVIAHTDDIRTLSYNGTGTVLASSGNDKTIKFWNTADLSNRNTIDNAHTGRINDLAFVDNDQKIISVSNDGYVKLWDIASSRCVNQKKCSAGINCIKLSEDKSRFITGDRSGMLVIWDLKSFNKIKSLHSGISDITALTVTPGMNYAFTGGKERRVSLLNLVTSNKVLDINTPHGITDLIFSNDFRSLEIGMYDGYRGKVDLEIEMSGDFLVAEDIFNELSHLPEAIYLADRINNYFTLALQKNAQTILNAFISGNDVPVSDELIDMATSHLDKALEITPENEFLYNKLLIDKKLLEAYTILKSNNTSSFQRAIGLIEEVKKKLPDASFTHNSLVAFYQKLNDLEKAKGSVEIAIKQIPEWTEPKLNLGKLYFQEGTYQKAIKEYETVLISNPEHSKAHKYLGDVLMFLGYYEDAMISYENAIKYGSSNIAALISFGELNAILGNFIEAEKLLKLAEAVDINNENLVVAKARIIRYLVARGTQDSVLDFGRSFQQLLVSASNNPNSTKISLELANYYSMLACYDDLFKEINTSNDEVDPIFEAEKLYGKLIQMDPFLIEAYAGIGDCLFYKQEYFQARKNYHKMLRKFESSAKSLFLMGTYYQKREREHKAISCFKKAISKDVNYTPAIYQYLQMNSKINTTKLPGDINDYQFAETDLYKNRDNLRTYNYLNYISIKDY